MEILPLTKDNVADCVDAFIASYNQMPWNYNWKHADAVTYLTEYLSCLNFTGFIIRDEKGVAGALLGHTKTWWTSNQFMIDELFVAADRQGKGYGKILLKQVEDYAAKNHIGTITLMTNKFMPAVHFYNKNDFNKVDQYIFMFKQL